MAHPDTIHKNYHEIKIVMTDGEEFSTYSTYGGSVLRLDVDPKTHPAWRGGSEHYVNLSSNQVSKFNERYAGLAFMSGKKSSES